MDELMKLYYELANTQVIVSMAEYAQAWHELADSFAMHGRPSMAESCYSRAKFYANHHDGEYIRLIEGSFSELLEA